MGGIIPARAGFTCPAGRASSVPTDHPRSRGVYACAETPEHGAHGSSPLARGLHGVDLRSAGLHGIIPARAGFTPQPSPDPAPPEDHPRSRGVYHGEHLHVFGSWGSSPLARGLLEVTIAGSPRERIIPARAGFTLRILGIPTNPHSTRPLPPSLPTRGPLRRVARAPPSFGAPPAADGRDLEDADATRPPRVSDPGSDTTPTCAGEWRRRPARSGSRRSGGSAPPRSRG